jgi:hypothetical protein
MEHTTSRLVTYCFNHYAEECNAPLLTQNGNLPQSAKSQVEDWYPGYRTCGRNNGGLVTWLPIRVTQQWRTGYMVTDQSDATMEDWLHGYRS